MTTDNKDKNVAKNFMELIKDKEISALILKTAEKIKDCIQKEEVFYQKRLDEKYPQYQNDLNDIYPPKELYSDESGLKEEYEKIKKELLFAKRKSRYKKVNEIKEDLREKIKQKQEVKNVLNVYLSFNKDFNLYYEMTKNFVDIFEEKNLKEELTAKEKAFKKVLNLTDEKKHLSLSYGVHFEKTLEKIPFDFSSLSEKEKQTFEDLKDLNTLILKYDLLFDALYFALEDDFSRVQFVEVFVKSATDKTSYMSDIGGAGSLSLIAYNDEIYDHCDNAKQVLNY